MKEIDVVILTDSRYVNPKQVDKYIENILYEDALVVNALQDLGLKTLRLAWDDAHFDWLSTRCALFRTTWDYHNRFDDFMDWLQKTSRQTQFINPKDLIEWNIDKHYLLDLQKSGIAIPKTYFIETGTQTTLSESIQTAKEEQGFTGSDFVLKPCVSATARHTYKFHESECQKYEPVFQSLVQKEAMMLQVFQKSIVEKGEISMIMIDSEFTHAVMKKARIGDFRVQDDFGGSVHEYRPNQKEIAFAESVVAACAEILLYARVDIFEKNDGGLALAELEIFEPELWFRMNKQAADKIAKAIYKTHFP